MQQAKEDGATVGIYYESRLVKLTLNKSETIDDDIDELSENEEDSEQAKLKSRWATLEKIVGAESRIKQVAADLVAHFEERNKAQVGKTMIVGRSRDICLHLYDAIMTLRPDWHSEDPTKGMIKVVMTGTVSDKPSLQHHIYPLNIRKNFQNSSLIQSDVTKIALLKRRRLWKNYAVWQKSLMKK
jgi:type I restriction enzyme R subunit